MGMPFSKHNCFHLQAGQCSNMIKCSQAVSCNNFRIKVWHQKFKIYNRFKLEAHASFIADTAVSVTGNFCLQILLSLSSINYV